MRWQGVVLVMVVLVLVGCPAPETDTRLDDRPDMVVDTPADTLHVAPEETDPLAPGPAILDPQPDDVDPEP